jgi:hypothetical protein
MTDKALALRFGDRAEVGELAQRIFDFLPGARDVPPEGRLALAQIAIAHGLDPFTGEVWAIPQRNRNGEVIGFRLMVGIAGWRAHAHRSSEYCGRVFRDCTPEERAALGAGSGDLAVRCIITRRKTGQHAMQFDGYGLFRRGEATKMNPLQAVRLRAERDAMKASFPLSLSVGVAAPVSIVDETGEVIDGEAVTSEAEAESGEPITYGAIVVNVQPRNSNGAAAGSEEAGKPARLYPPEILKAKLAERAEANARGEVNSKQRGLFVGKLAEVFAPDPEADAKRRAVVHWLFGVESSKDLTAPQVLAGLEWLKLTKDESGDYRVDAMAEREARLVFEQAMKEAEGVRSG